jgi:hypothetical protein
MYITEVPLSNTQGSSLSIMTELRAGRPRLGAWQGQEFPFLHHRVQTGSGAHPFSYPLCAGGPRGQSVRAVKVTTHLHLLPSLRMRGSIPPLSLWLHGVVLSTRYVFMAGYLVKHRGNFNFTLIVFE